MGGGYDSYVNYTIKPLQIHGIILEKFEEATGCFGGIIIKESDHLDTLRKIFYCTPQENKVWSYVLAGDSIYKEQGTLEVFISRKDSTRRFTFPTRD
jgi:hypothetical protein